MRLTQAVPTVQIDNERVRVTEWRFAPGAETGEHVHAMDYVVVPLASGRLKIVSPGWAGKLCRADAGRLLYAQGWCASQCHQRQ